MALFQAKSDDSYRKSEENLVMDVENRRRKSKWNIGHLSITRKLTQEVFFAQRYGD